MKKLKYALIFILIFLTASAITTAFAEDGISVTRVLPDDEFYAQLSSPLFTVSSEEYKVFFQESGITVKSAGASFFLPSENTPTSGYVYDNYLIYTSASLTSYLIQVYDVSARSLVDVDFSDVVGDCVSVFGYGNRFYVYNGTKTLYAYDVSDAGITLKGSIEKGALFSQATGFCCTADYITFIKQNTVLVYTLADETYTDIHLTATGLAANGGTLYLINGDVLRSYDFADSTIAEKKLSFSPDSVSASGDFVYLTHKSDNCVEIYKSDLTFYNVYAGSGKYDTIFDSPSDVAATDGKILIADSANDRIAIFDESYSYVNEYSCPAPKVVAANGNYLFVATSSQIAGYRNGSAFAVSTSVGDIVDIAVDKNGVMYALDVANFRIWKLEAGKDELSVFAQYDKLSSTPVSISVSEQGTALYVAFTNRLEMLSADASTLMNVSYDGTGLYDKEIVQIKADYYGNVFVLLTDGTEQKIVRLLHTLTSFTSKEEYLLPSVNGSVFDSFDFTTDGGILLLSNNTNSVYLIDKDDVNVITSHNITPIAPPVDVTDKTPVTDELTVLSVNTATYLYSSPENFEDTISLANGDQVILLSSDESLGDYYYVVTKTGSAGYITRSSAQALSRGAVYNSEAIVLFNTYLYKYPVDKSEFAIMSVLKNEELTVLSNLNGFDNGRWQAVTFDSGVYYMLTSCLGEKSEPAITSKIYAKIITDSIGTSVKVFARADSASSVLANLSDGTEVQLFAEIDPSSTFTRVRYGDITGYVYTANLSKAILTTAQITAIILLSLAAVISITVFLINRKIKKNNM